MQSKYAIALDLGTTAVKASLVDADGRVRAVAAYECTLETPGPNRVEQDPSAWFEHACKLIAQVVTGVDPADVLGVGITSQGISFVLTDEAFVPLGNAISWLDTRATDEAERILARYPEKELFAMTGKYAPDGYTLPALLWVAEHQPEQMAQARHCLMPMD